MESSNAFGFLAGLGLVGIVLAIVTSLFWLRMILDCATSRLAGTEKIVARHHLSPFHRLSSPWHKDVRTVCKNCIDVFRIDPENRYVAALLAKAGWVDDHKLEELSALTLVYAVPFLTEGIGLFLKAVGGIG
jgi:hypothetical protein